MSFSNLKSNLPKLYFIKQWLIKMNLIGSRLTTGRAIVHVKNRFSYFISNLASIYLLICILNLKLNYDSD